LGTDKRKMKFLDFFIKKTLTIYYSRFLGFILHNQLYFLKKELCDCESVLDLGCGWKSLLLYIPVKFSLGTDLWYPYLLESKARNIHRYYIQADLKKEIPFKENSFDAVLLLSVIEHLEKENGLSLLIRYPGLLRKKLLSLHPTVILNRYINPKLPYRHIFQVGM
jgi:cyclopropane fatty-acyl-phospholipid synthase-like methyltransferase